MHRAHEFLTALTIVFVVAGLTTIVFQRLRQPAVLGYLLAGLIVGPFVPVPVVADRDTVTALSELGVILLMFSLGLEFSIRKLVKVAPTAGVIALLETSLMVLAGSMLARAFGWSPREAMFAGAMVAISSTTIVARAFGEERVTGALRELVVGILIVEDVIAVLLIALLTAVSTGEGLSAHTLLESGGRLLAFLVGLVSVGLWVVPPVMRVAAGLRRPETTLVASVGLCFGIALVARAFGYSVALGAFLAGSLIAESGQEKEVERLVVPVRDLFAAVFFVSVGMMVDPHQVTQQAGAIAAFVVLVIVGKVLGVTLGAFLTGQGTRTSVQAGMSLAQIGEFSFIIAGLGLGLGATGSFLYTTAVAVSAVTTLTTPWLIRGARPVAAFVDRKLPRPLQTFVVLYGSWLEQLRASRHRRTAASAVKRLARLLVLDVAMLVALVIATAVWLDDVAGFAARTSGLATAHTRAAVITGAALLATPLLLGIVRLSRGLGTALALAALPRGAHGRVDLAAAPRKAFVVTMQLAIVLGVGFVVNAATQAFLPAWLSLSTLGVMVAVLAVVFWRSATDLEGHVKAGTEMIVEVLQAQTSPEPAAEGTDALAPVRQLLPGLGAPVTLRLEASDAAVGKTLAQTNLRGLTGASVLAIARGADGAVVPTASEVLRAGDVLALAGTSEAIRLATAALREGVESRDDARRTTSEARPRRGDAELRDDARETTSEPVSLRGEDASNALKLTPSAGAGNASWRGVAVYLVLTMGLSWLAAWLLRETGVSAARPLGTRFLTAVLLHALTMGWPPLLAVWLVRRHVDGPGYLDHGLRAARPRFVLLAAAAPLVLVAASSALAWLRGADVTAAPPEVDLQAMSHTWTGALALLLTFAGTLALVWAHSLMEELGWRGFLLARLSQRLGAWPGLLLQGLLWGLWYAPVVLLVAGDARPSVALGVVTSFALWGVLLGGLRLVSRSIVPTTVANAVLTMSAGLPLLLLGASPGIRGAAFGPMGWPVLAVAVVLLAALTRSRAGATSPSP